MMKFNLSQFSHWIFSFLWPLPHPPSSCVPRFAINSSYFSKPFLFLLSNSFQIRPLCSFTLISIPFLQFQPCNVTVSWSWYCFSSFYSSSPLLQLAFLNRLQRGIITPVILVILSLTRSLVCCAFNFKESTATPDDLLRPRHRPYRLMQNLTRYSVWTRDSSPPDQTLFTIEGNFHSLLTYTIFLKHLLEIKRISLWHHEWVMIDRQQIKSSLIPG